MIRINLLPFRAARKKENIRRQVSIFVLSLAFLLITLFYFNAKLNDKIGNLNANIKNTKTELEKYNQINKEIAEIKKQLNNLKKKLAVMETLEANRFEPTRLLDIMTQAIVPKRMWFTSLQTDANKVAINGIALDNKTVADFMVRLEQCDLFKGVNLKTLKSKKVQNADFKNFQIVCTKKTLTNPSSDNTPGNDKAEE
jgi:type IV pilus assembly protein PilN